MSIVLKFRMLSDEDDNFFRDYEIDQSSTLKEFHSFICEDLEYDDYEPASFFLSDSSWQKLKEFTVNDMGINEQVDDEFVPMPMTSITIGEIISANYERMLFVFDLIEDRAYFIDLIEPIKPEDDRTYPRVLLAHGEAPDQFDAKLSTENRSIFDEAMDDWDDFGGNDDSSSDEY